MTIDDFLRQHDLIGGPQRNDWRAERDDCGWVISQYAAIPPELEVDDVLAAAHDQGWDTYIMAERRVQFYYGTCDCPDPF